MSAIGPVDFLPVWLRFDQIDSVMTSLACSASHFPADFAAVRTLQF
jgi:hypothetical protein